MARTNDSTRNIILTWEGWLGVCDYSWLCLPALPSMLLTMSCLYCLQLRQVCSMLAGMSEDIRWSRNNIRTGLIAPPIVFASTLSQNPATSAYMISAYLIASAECHYLWAANACVFDSTVGILNLVQMSRIKLFGGYYLGTGLISGERSACFKCVTVKWG